ncbi:hypothetical protein TrST_g8085 [Triparma strigata]|uniref:Splicing factor Cactin n=1 Tax=Triparma strigata TaxID=1606541 RepID=A0A9W6ZNM8_9STRA|nr:hypothetical protein TrST_g8085 [Triparma strigata]
MSEEANDVPTVVDPTVVDTTTLDPTTINSKKKRSRSSSSDSSKGRASPHASTGSGSDSSSDSSSSEEERRKKKKKKKNKKKEKKEKKEKKSKKSKKSKKAKKSSSDPSFPSADSNLGLPAPVISESLLRKLAEKNETLSERKARKERERNAQMAGKFGYSNDENPFNDPNLNESFTWGKKVQTNRGVKVDTSTAADKRKHQEKLVEEIEKVRRRRIEREEEFDEMQRLREEESRLREAAHYDDWQRKEEEFHLAQQHQRTAIRLVEGREKPVDVLAKNVLLFGLSEEEKANKTAVKYKERYNALDEMANLDATLTAPGEFCKNLKLEELIELQADLREYQELEKEVAGSDSSSLLSKYWDALAFVCSDEIAWINGGGSGGNYEKVSADIAKMFSNQSTAALEKMKAEIVTKIHAGAANGDASYWQSVLTQLRVHLAKEVLTKIHNEMLVRQLAKLEEKAKKIRENGGTDEQEKEENPYQEPDKAGADGGDEEDELGEEDEVEVAGGKPQKWASKYKPRKPRYFNRVKTGWDWNKYNQTHYDHDNPPPKVVQGYKFSIFYPDLIDKSKTPQFFVEAADSPEFCILRFHAGPPYEDLAFKILNKEWAKKKKQGYKCVFDRGVLTLFFNFNSHWYRR